MKTYDNETEIIDHFQSIDAKSIMLVPENKETENITELISDKNKWSEWTNSSGKSDPPPDFYSDKYKLMLDVMRIDDHGYLNSKGKVVNPTYARERELIRELEKNNFDKIFPNASVFFTVNTGLPTEQDHNFEYYLANFKRIVEKHKSKIKLYKDNHPGYKTIFFVFDESSAYIETDATNIDFNQACLGRAHIWFFDEEFVNIFRNSEIDYLVWFTPFKLMQSVDRYIDLPKAVVYDTKNIDIDVFRYCRAKMKSSEI